MMSDMTVGALISDVQQRCGSAATLPSAFLLREYNAILCSLTLQKPAADAVLTATPEDGRIQTGLSATQIRRVLTEDGELLPASLGLFELLPEEPLCFAADGEVLVHKDAPCRILYRALPHPVTDAEVQTAPVTADVSELPLLYEALCLRAYTRLGDTEKTALCRTEYDRLYRAFRRENGLSAVETEVTTA